MARHSSENEKPPSAVQDSDNPVTTSTKDQDEKGVQDLSVGVVIDPSPLDNKPTITLAATTHDTTGPPTSYVKELYYTCFIAKIGSVLLVLSPPIPPPPPPKNNNNNNDRSIDSRLPYCRKKPKVTPNHARFQEAIYDEDGRTSYSKSRLRQPRERSSISYSQLNGDT